VLESLDLPETVRLVLAIVVVEQPITRAEIAARRLEDSAARYSCCCATA
jgi:chromosome segregation and condensation protein ScpB